MASRPPGPFATIVDQSAGATAGGVEFRYANGPLQAFDTDVVHVLAHDIERIADSSRGPLPRRLANALTFAARIRRHRVALVQTIVSADAGASRGIVRRVLDAVTTSWVVLDDESSSPRNTRTVRLPHSHYRDRFTGYPDAPPHPGRILCASTVDLSASLIPIPGFLSVLESEDISLRLVGDASKSLVTATARLERRHPRRLSSRFGRISHGALVQEIDAAEMILQPRVSTFTDHQLLLFALSRDRPVIAPSTETTRRLRHEVGDKWLHLYGGELTAVVLRDAVTAFRASPPAQRPTLDDRDPTAVADSYAFMYRSIVAKTRPRARRTEPMS